MLSFSTAERLATSSLPPDAAHVSLSPETVGNHYGFAVVMAPQRVYKTNWSAPRRFVQCSQCHRTGWTDERQLKQGLVKGCRPCSTGRQTPPWLLKRATAAKQRCVNQNDPSYQNYGGRGIGFAFSSPLAMALWVQRHLGPLQKDKDLDRIDNNGDYAPGNLRWATRSENNQNNRRAVVELANWRAMEWPYSELTVARKLRQGLSREEILTEARDAVLQKRKNWRGISAKLKSMTSRTPDPETGSRPTAA